MRYRLESVLGEGAHGTVWRARDADTSALVAVKKIQLSVRERRDVGAEQHRQNVLREAQTMRHLSQHPNILQLLHVMVEDECCLVLITELLHTDLGRVLSERRRPLPESAVKCLLRMLLEGVAFCHDHSVLHRDLKPSNLLLSADGVLKLSDFGLARQIPSEADSESQEAERPMSHKVATRWYRAPELLYGARKYGTGVDMWAVGCIFGEMLNLSPLFPGRSDIDQLCCVLSTMGTPTADTWPEAEALPDYHKISFQKMSALPWDQVVPNSSKAAQTLLQRILVLSPDMRICAQKALTDEYFTTQPLPDKTIPLQLLKLSSSKPTTFNDIMSAPLPDIVQTLLRQSSIESGIAQL